MVEAIKLFLSLTATIGGFVILVAILYNNYFWVSGGETIVDVLLLAGGITSLWLRRKSLKR